MSSYLVYHPQRVRSDFKQAVVHHDDIKGNQDPYIWSNPFLHTFCHITQMSPEAGYINFWVSGDSFTEFNSLICDLVFVVQERIYWRKANEIHRSDPIIESDEAFNDHYRWGNTQHYLKRRRRYTLKANPDKSFQPQDDDFQLIDVIPILIQSGLSVDQLRRGLRQGFAARPMRIQPTAAKALYDFLVLAPIRLNGLQLQSIRQQNSDLASH